MCIPNPAYHLDALVVWSHILVAVRRPIYPHIAKASTTWQMLPASLEVPSPVAIALAGGWGGPLSPDYLGATIRYVMTIK